MAEVHATESANADFFFNGMVGSKSLLHAASDIRDDELHPGSETFRGMASFMASLALVSVLSCLPGAPEVAAFVKEPYARTGKEQDDPIVVLSCFSATV